MQYFSHFFQPLYTNILEQYGGFFAFGTEQFEKQKKPDTRYISLDGGLLLALPPDATTAEQKKAYVQRYFDDLDKAIEQATKEDIEAHGIDRIISRELNNHECFYTGDISDALRALQKYNVTEEQVRAIYRAELKFHD